jgi:excisionase family DNA binding protein
MTTLNLLTPPKAAKLLGVSYATLRKFLARQELTTITIGQRILISEESLREYIANRTRPAQHVA